MFPPSGVEISIPLKSTTKNIDFTLDVESKRLELHGYKYQNRVYKDIILARLDLGPKSHRNPNDAVITGPHIHIYQEGYHDKFAYSIPNEFFTQISDKWIALEEFMNFCNIVGKPIIREGLDYV